MGLKVEEKDFFKAWEYQRTANKYLASQDFKNALSYQEKALIAGDDSDIRINSFPVIAATIEDEKDKGKGKVQELICPGELQDEITYLRQEEEATRATGSGLLLSLIGFLCCFFPIVIMLFYEPVQLWMEENIYDLLMIIYGMAIFVGFLMSGFIGCFLVGVVLIGIAYGAQSIMEPEQLLLFSSWGGKIVIAVLIFLIAYTTFGKGIKRNMGALNGAGEERRRAFKERKENCLAYIEAIQKEAEIFSEEIKARGPKMMKWIEERKETGVTPEILDSWCRMVKEYYQNVQKQVKAIGKK